MQQEEKKDSLRAGIEVSRVMNALRSTAFDTFYVRYKDSIYYSTYKGKIFSADSLGRGRHFIFDLKSEYLVDDFYFHPLEDSRYFLAWQETDHRGVKSRYAVITRGAQKPDWIRTQNAPSPGQPIIDDEAVYISSLGMIAKLHLSTGQPYWVHDSLFDQYKLLFKSFERPLIYKSTVCFYDKPIKGKKTKRDSIWVDDRSGKIIPKPRAK